MPFFNKRSKWKHLLLNDLSILWQFCVTDVVEFAIWIDCHWPVLKTQTK